MTISDSQTETIRRRYNRTALFYDWMDKMISVKLRQKAIQQAEGKVLEIGVGTGANLEYYLPGCQVTGIDFSPGMLEKAMQKQFKAKVPVTLLEMDAQNMSFPDNTFDTVISTCVFCSVPDPVQGLKEAKRVCKPNGRIILLEHVRSENPILGLLMDILNPLALHIIGSNINRDTVMNIHTAGIKPLEMEEYSGKIIKLIIASPNE
ncbi:class I SAM-dependent methyltransferase [Sporomusa acidovorans]|uniref:class I SAM-dependent methyltransferase n=1 Tax=Sporomusa acidovorans TaxID=112900 RepID=UPI00089127FB|nr:class I SAM-dependent methyltransferase [Sporomusa acidovorans]OZC18981.1 demethylmenaquinone methyltransferase [Sporomusa acidovorans DSM 3132]SDD71948.1 Ubiquinone/menaquinone biosynthesis C-methylase UbiE [Sporomusa acidovorans]